MPSFDDNKGRTWVLEINVNTVKRVRSLADCDLLDTENGEIIRRLSSDPILLCDVLFAICKPQAEEKGISDVEFGKGLAGDAIADATEALLEALANFFPGRRASLLKGALQKMETVEEKYLDKVEAKLNSPEMMDQMEAELEEQIPGDSSTEQPESSE